MMDTVALGKFCPACQSIPTAGHCARAGCPTAPTPGSADKMVMAVRQAIVAASPRVGGRALVDVETTIRALATCQAYLIAGSPEGLRQGLLALADSVVSAKVADLVRSGHAIVGTGFTVTIGEA